MQNIIKISIFIIIIFIIGVFFLGLNKDTNYNTSFLTGKKISNISLEYFDENKFYKQDDLKRNNYTLINFWASWCAPCRVEAPIIEELSNIIPIVGIAYKDKVQNTKKFLDDYGNPYDQIGLDTLGEIAIEWGVYGVPETFIINANGKIIYRHAGPLLYNVFQNEVLPLIRRK